MPNVGEVAQFVGSFGSVLVAAIAIIVNNRTTRANLDAQRQASTDQLEQQREALTTTLTAQAQQIRDERLWDRRMALYEDLGAWSGKAFSNVSLLMFEITALPEKDFEENFKEPFNRLSEAVGSQYFPLLGRVQLYAEDTVRDAFLGASPSVVGLAGKYNKKNAVKWVNDLFSAVSNLQDVLRATIREVAAGVERGQPSKKADIGHDPTDLRRPPRVPPLPPRQWPDHGGIVAAYLGTDRPSNHYDVMIAVGFSWCDDTHNRHQQAWTLLYSARLRERSLPGPGLSRTLWPCFASRRSRWRDAARRWAPIARLRYINRTQLRILDSYRRPTAACLPRRRSRACGPGSSRRWPGRRLRRRGLPHTAGAARVHAGCFVTLQRDISPPMYQARPGSLRLTDGQGLVLRGQRWQSGS
jgi:hypothetical protein